MVRISNGVDNNINNYSVTEHASVLKNLSTGFRLTPLLFKTCIRFGYFTVRVLLRNDCVIERQADKRACFSADKEGLT